MAPLTADMESTIPSVLMSEFARRRQVLLEKLGPKTVILISNPPTLLRNGDCDYPYRPRSDFYYLTGFQEPNAVALLYSTEEGARFILFTQPKDPAAERWSGKRIGQLGAVTDYLADESYPLQELGLRLPKYLVACHSVCFLLHQDSIVEQQVRVALASLRGVSRVRDGQMISPGNQWIDLRGPLHEMRLIKSPFEMQFLQRAVDISTSAHKRAMQVCRPGLFEYEIEAELLHEFYRRGSRAVAYQNIVATGENACVLHYHENRMPLAAGQLLLIDAGCEYHYYASDITRTFPVSGKFTSEQRKLYQLVLSTQEAIIQHVRPNVTWESLEAVMGQHLTTGLIDLGLLQGEFSTLLEQKAYRRFCPHSAGHWLGLDVHDVGHYRGAQGSRLLQVGMVFTVEPGLYIPADMIEVNAAFRGVGIRIEDDVRVTEGGCEVLSQGVPKAIDEIEALMQ